jgi:hypothetical protein
MVRVGYQVLTAFPTAARIIGMRGLGFNARVQTVGSCGPRHPAEHAKSLVSSGLNAAGEAVAVNAMIALAQVTVAAGLFVLASARDVTLTAVGRATLTPWAHCSPDSFRCV